MSQWHVARRKNSYSKICLSNITFLTFSKQNSIINLDFSFPTIKKKKRKKEEKRRNES